jgi:hypothetical protein
VNVLKKSVEKHMSSDYRDAFMSLHNCKSKDPSDLLGIKNTNAVSIGLLPGFDVTHSAVFKDLSRINHRFVVHYLEVSRY